MKTSKFILALIFLVRSALFANELPLLDFDKMVSDFILDEKQIMVPGYPDAFNPSIIRWGNGKLLLCFRYRDQVTKVANLIGFAWLNEDFVVEGDPILLTITGDLPLKLSKAQGPRLIKIGNIYYIAYNNSLSDKEPEARRMILAHLHYSKNKFYINEPKLILSYKGDPKHWREKNWSPFDYKGYIHFSYTLDPHQVIKYSKTDNKYTTVAITDGFFDWDLGELHGRTPALLDGDHYIGFFHSWKELKSEQSNGIKKSHFFMGAYRFGNKPPFQLTHISEEPIMGKTFFHAPEYTTWKPLKVIYPGGFVFNEDYIWVVYGRQDHECWVLKMDKKGLINSLAPIYRE